MSKRNKNRKPPSQRNGNSNSPQATRRFLEPPPSTLTDLSTVWICPSNNPALQTPGTDEKGKSETGFGSRGNSLKRGLRSKLLFPIEMKEYIEDLAREFAFELKPKGRLQEWLVFEMARSQVQSDRASDQLLVNDMRIIERVGTAWDDDGMAKVEKLAARISKAPRLVAGALGRCKQGALYLINQWTLLADIVATNGALDEEFQRQAVFDFLGIDPIYRNGCRQVPAATDAAGLSALIAREIDRHRTNLERSLNGRDASERDMALLGIVAERDAETRLLRSDQTRAQRRLTWAMKTLEQLQKGVAPADIIDPETRKPVDPGAYVSPSPAPTPAPAPVPDPAPAPPAPPEPEPAPSIPPLPAEISAEAKEMWLVAAGAVLSQKAASPADEPAPPPPA